MTIKLFTMSALVARLAALALFLLWNFHAGLHFMHGHAGHDGDHEAGSAYGAAAEDEDCGACLISVAPGLLGQQPLLPVTESISSDSGAEANVLLARLFTCAVGRGPPSVSV